MGMDHEPGFNWWVMHTLRMRDWIIALLKKHDARYLKHTHKFGVECLLTVENELELDKQNGNTMWTDVIAKEMKNVQVAFALIEDDAQPSKGYQFFKC